MTDSTITAEIRKDYHWDSAALVERRQWRVSLSNGRRRLTTTRREAEKWCAEMGVPFVVVPND